MTAVAVSLLAVAVSVCALFALGVRDPERVRVNARRRNLEAAKVVLGANQRRVLCAAALAPGFLLALAGVWPAAVIWAGSCLIAGWVLTLGLRNAG
jgi:hypothetical protein